MTQAKKTRQRRPQAAQAIQRRRKRRRSGSRALYYIIFFLLFSVALIILSRTVFFKIDNIDVTVSGEERYTNEEIISVSGVSTGDNLFKVDKKEISGKLLERLPYIEAVKIRRWIPDRLKIDITQSVPSGALLDGSDYLLITDKGKILERGLVFIPEDVPVIKGIDTAALVPGEYLGEDCAEQLKMLDYLFKAAETTGFSGITNVDLTDLYNMKIVYENRLLLNLGTEFEMMDKLKFLKEILAKHMPEDAEGVVDASNINKSVILQPMPIQDAIDGKKFTKKPVEIKGISGAESGEDLEPQESEDEKDVQSSE